tara:strand:- start:85704 stop:86738 length:1035 start_codon:yes stop_codon:yes gene_type:complete
MRCRDHIALTLPSFLLRLTLAVTFLWAGTSKLVGTSTTDGDNAARLANLGVTFIQEHPVVPTPKTNDEPIKPLPNSEPEIDSDTDNLDTPVEPVIQKDQPANPATGQSPDQSIDPSAQLPIDPNLEQQTRSNLVSIRNIVQTTAPAVGSDFPQPVTYRNLYNISLLLDRAGSPGLTEDSQPISPIVPSWMGQGKVPVIAAWATAITELTCGAFLLIGFLTRFSALSLCVVMLVAMWITQIGPAAMQTSDAILGFIPNTQDPWNPGSYSVLLWQLAIVTMTLSVALLGAGPLSLDRMLFRPGRRDPYVSGESRPPQPKPKPEPLPKPHDRGEFDRSPPPQHNPTP